MKKIFLNTTLLGLMYLNISHGANAQITIDIPEAPSTVHAVYVSQSSKKVLNPSEKLTGYITEIFSKSMYCNV